MTFVIVAQKILYNVFIAIILQKFNELTVKNQIYRIEEDSFEKNTNLMKSLAIFLRKQIKRCKGTK